MRYVCEFVCVRVPSDPQKWAVGMVPKHLLQNRDARYRRRLAGNLQPLCTHYCAKLEGQRKSHSMFGHIMVSDFALTYPCLCVVGSEPNFDDLDFREQAP